MKLLFIVQHWRIRVR